MALTLAAPQEAGESSKVEMKQGYAVVGFFGGLSLLAVVQLWGGAVNELLRAVLTIIGLMLAGGSGYISLTAMRKVADIGERMERIVDTARDAFVTINEAGVITGWNPAAEATFGWSRAEAVGRALAETIIPERYRDGHRKGLAHFLATGEGPVLNQRLELEALHHDGHELPVELIIYPVRVGGEQTFNAFVHDITERRQAEEALARSNAELSALNKELETFSYSVSHDLRAPLRSVAGFSQLLLEDYKDRLDERGEHYLVRMQEASQRMGKLIDDLLSLSRLTRAQIHQEPIDLSELAKTIAVELREREPERRVQFCIQEVLTGHGDPEWVRVVLQNLLDNAWKFTSKHSSARIELGALHQDGEVVYFVRDDGAGFDMEYTGKLFGAFQRLHGAREFAGTGVGLATAQRIIHRHGGRIWAEGAVEEGATFYFTLT